MTKKTQEMLFFATYLDYMADKEEEKFASKIWMYDGKKTEQVATRKDMIIMMHSHRGRLFDGSIHGNIYLTLEDVLGENPVATRSGPVYAMTTHKGGLYDGGCRSTGGIMYGGGVYKTLLDRRGKKPLVKSPYPVLGLCSMEDRLYYSLKSKGLFALGKRKVLNKDVMGRLFAFKDMMYCAAEEVVCTRFGNAEYKIRRLEHPHTAKEVPEICDEQNRDDSSYMTLPFSGPSREGFRCSFIDPIYIYRNSASVGAAIGERGSQTKALFTYKGKMMDAGVYRQIISTLDNEVLYRCNGVKAMTSHRIKIKASMVKE